MSLQQLLGQMVATPEALGAKYLLSQSTLLSEIQSWLYQEQQTMYQSLANASKGTATAIQNAGNNQGDATSSSAIGQMTGAAVSGVAEFGGMGYGYHQQTRGDIATANTGLSNHAEWKTVLDQIDSGANPVAVGQQQGGVNVQANQRNFNNANFATHPSTQPAAVEEAVAMKSAPDREAAWKGKMQDHKDKGKQLNDQLHDAQQALQSKLQRVNVLSQATSQLLQGIFGTQSANNTKSAAVQQAIQQGQQNAAETLQSMTSNSPAQAVDQQKSQLYQIMQALSDSQRA